MINLVLTMMISAFSLAQPDAAAITTNELAPPTGMSGTGAPASPQKMGAPAKTKQVAAGKSVSEKPTAPKDDVVVENAQPAGGAVAPATAPPGSSDATQPTTEERQAPTTKQSNSSGGPGRVAAFWFILPNRPSENK